VTLKDIQEDVASIKYAKKLADENNNLEIEYEYHNMLKKAKASLKKFVALQKAVKMALKGY
jgi:hypothetical protein